jgi:hypothetical protein
MRIVIRMLDDPSDAIYESAKAKLERSTYQNPQILIESLSIPRRKVREGIFHLLESLNISNVDVQQFANTYLRRAYTNLSESIAVDANFKSSIEKDILKDHLVQKKDLKVETLLRVLALHDQSGRMRVIWRGMFSTDSRKRSNALEAFEDMVGRRFAQSILPLVEGLSYEECLSTGARFFDIPTFQSDGQLILRHLLNKRDWVTIVLTLNLIRKVGMDGMDTGSIEKLMEFDNIHVKAIAMKLLGHIKNNKSNGESVMEDGIGIPEKIMHLRKIQIFEGLTVSELAAIASVTEEIVYPEGQTVIKEGEQGETMYMIVSGEVSVIKGRERGDNIELDRIEEGDYFGEMALFDEMVRSATIVTTQQTRLLVLHKHEFREIVREYPQIALHICKILSQRLRRVHERIKDCA